MGIVLCTTYIPFFFGEPGRTCVSNHTFTISNKLHVCLQCKLCNIRCLLLIPKPSEMMQLSKSQECSDKEHKVMTTTQSSQESKCSPTPTLKSIQPTYSLGWLLCRTWSSSICINMNAIYLKYVVSHLVLHPLVLKRKKPMTPKIALEIQGEIGPCAGENGGYTHLFLPMLQKSYLHGHRT